MSLNKCMIIGNLGRDPEMRYTPSGQAVTQFTVAVNRNYKDAQGERQEETEWFRVVSWGSQAEFAAEYLRKGNKVYIEGRIQTRQWEDENKLRHWKTEIVANALEMLSGRRKKDYATEASAQALEAQAEADGFARVPALAEDDADPEADLEDEAEQSELVAA